MAFKLTKRQETDRQIHVDELRKAHTVLEKAIEDYNEKINDAKEFVEGVASDWRTEFDERSEGWQEGETGQVVEELISNWESMEFFDAEAAPEDPSDAVADLPGEV